MSALAIVCAISALICMYEAYQRESSPGAAIEAFWGFLFLVAAFFFAIWEAVNA